MSSPNKRDEKRLCFGEGRENNNEKEKKPMISKKSQAYAVIDQKAELLCRVSDDIWEHPETGMLEFQSAEILASALEAEGFTVNRGIAGIETAFTAQYGSGHPIIGLLGEYDALAGMSQSAGALEKCAAVSGGAGHACGHNLIGAGTMAAAVGIKAYLEQNQIPGTVIYYGCPGEESSSCKSFMARDGVFRDVDLALAFHPNSLTYVNAGGTLANCRIYYKFEGRAAHAAVCPEKGRSGLDAVELLNIGVQFLREHVDSSVRMHYAIVDTGGTSPNVVQDHAEVLYVLRAAKDQVLQETIERVDAIAQGAALMTGTTLKRTFVKAIAAMIPNSVVGRQVAVNAQNTPMPEILQTDLDLAASYCQTFPSGEVPIQKLYSYYGKEKLAELQGLEGKVFNDFVLPYPDFEITMMASTDVGDVSAVCPTAIINIATQANGTPEHSWQMTAQGKTPLAHKMMLYAGKVLAGTGIDFLEDLNLVRQAKEEYDRRTGGTGYQPLMPMDLRPIPM